MLLADPALIAPAIPTFWTDVYAGRDVVAALLRGVAAAGQLTEDAVAGLANAVAPATADPLRRWRWLPLPLAAADRRPAPPIDYGSGAVFGPQPGTGDVYRFGAPTDGAVSYPLPAGVVTAAAVTDRVAAPTRVWAVGVDCKAAGGRVVFPADPLAGAAAGTLWLADAAVEATDLSRRFGTVLGLGLPSTAGGRAAAVAGYAVAAEGASDLGLRALLGAVAGVPCVAADGEVVAAVLTDVDATRVVTDAAVYLYRAGAVPTVAAGDTLAAGDWPVAGVGLYAAAALPSALVPDVALDPGLTGLADTVTVPNRSVALTVTVADGHLRVEWPMGGAGATVTAFFAAAHAAGVAAGKTVGDTYDRRATPDGPLPTVVPPADNPFARLAAQGVLDGARFFVLSAAVGDTAAVAAALPAVRDLLPPHVRVIVVPTA